MIYYTAFVVFLISTSLVYWAEPSLLTVGGWLICVTLQLLSFAVMFVYFFLRVLKTEVQRIAVGLLVVAVVVVSWVA